MFKQNALVKEMDGLHKFAYKLTGNKADSDDLLQSTVCRALEKKNMFQTDTDLFKWTSKIMYNQFVSQYRRKVKFETQYDPEPHIEKQTVKTRQDKERELQEVGDAIEQLNDEHRDVLLMVSVKGMRYKTVAEKLNIPVGTVRSRLYRAREQLEEHLNINDSRNDNVMASKNSENDGTH